MKICPKHKTAKICSQFCQTLNNLKNGQILSHWSSKEMSWACSAKLFLAELFQNIIQGFGISTPWQNCTWCTGSVCDHGALPSRGWWRLVSAQLSNKANKLSLLFCNFITQQHTTWADMSLYPCLLLKIVMKVTHTTVLIGHGRNNNQITSKPGAVEWLSWQSGCFRAEVRSLNPVIGKIVQ